MRRVLNWISFGLVLGLLTACGEVVPEAYRGEFVDAASGAKLQMNAESGVYQETSGRIVKARTHEISFEELRKGASGVFMRDNPTNAQILEVYWVSPDLTTKQEAGGIESYQAEVFFFRMEKSKQTKIDLLNTVHSREGIISLDVPTSQWQIGWPAGSSLLEFRRVQPKAN